MEEISGVVEEGKFNRYGTDYYFVNNSAVHNDWTPMETQCYIAIHYEKDERKPMYDRIQCISVFHSFEDREDTEFYLNVDKARDAEDHSGYYWNVEDEDF